jgi:hypothetical protein
MEAIYSAEDVGKLVGIKTDSVLDAIHRKSLVGAVQVGRVWVIPESALKAWQDKRQARLFRLQKVGRRRRRER